MPPLPRIGLVGPDQTQPCGIADYTARLRPALEARCDLVFAPFRAALGNPDLKTCRALLVQYERSLVPDGGFLRRLAEDYPDKVFVVPHEVYAEDPFAFPYADLHSAFPPLLWAKRLRYRLRHRGYAREKALQARAYDAHRVIPLSPESVELLRAACGPAAAARILAPVPPACPDASGFAAPAEPPDRRAWFANPPRRLLGIFGFVNPSVDYAAALDLVLSLGQETGLLIVGGARADAGAARALERAIAARGLQGNVKVTGYLPPESLEAPLQACDLFLCPFRFKSNSASILHLFHLGKPILAADLPLTRFLRAQGAPIELYVGREDMADKARALLAGQGNLQGTYRWSFPGAAQAYLEAMLSS